ncbi:hypothetical protein [Auritidibacter ignavus]|uniref:baeRF3 domain-containing protein n=1 Tax=Auritidibacter ignavus TaxID=678932 RepID=UPI0024BB6D55|nr:hypothetical protein [Auritidibacter ignavus]WHS28874.1 hypothetical protein QM395_03850 [Auritidibacter ignavus]
MGLHGQFDQITAEDLQAMATAEGLKVSIFLPTNPIHHSSSETATRIKSALNEAKKQASDPDAINQIVAPLEELVSDPGFVRDQSETLALFAADGFWRAYRLGVPVTEYVHVNQHFVLRPIAEALTESSAFYILALAQNKVRLFDATKDTVTELELNHVPESREEWESDDRSSGYTPGVRGNGNSNFEVEQQKFLHDVGASLGDELGRARSQPLVVASVSELVPEVRGYSSYPVVTEEFLAGNPETKSGAELRDEVWEQIIRPRFAAADDAEYERFANVAGTGLGETQPDVIRDGAVEGRVDRLFINPALSASDGTGQVNTAILHTLLNSGRVIIISDGRVENVAALMRY